MKEDSTDTYPAPVIEFRSDSIRVYKTGSANSSESGVRINKAIQLDAYNTVNFEIRNEEGYDREYCIKIFSGYPNYYGDSALLQSGLVEIANNTTGTISLSISSLKQTGYIVVYQTWNTFNSWYITRIYFT